MDSERAECMHDWAHGPVGPVLAHGQPKICRMCGHEATSPVVSMVAVDYHNQLAKKNAGGFKGAR
jgi:hypothetical protein